MLEDDRWWTCFESAALDSARWMSALSELAEATASNRAQLIGFGGAHAEPFNWITNIDESDWLYFPDANGHSPTVNFRVAADAADTDIICEYHYDRIRSTLSDDSYVAFCEHARMPLGCHKMLIRSEHGQVGMALLRTHGDGATDERVRSTFTEAARAARTAVRLQVALEQQGAALVGGAFETLSIASLLFDRHGRIRDVSPTAQRLLTANGPVDVRDLRLVGATPHAAAQIDRAFDALLVTGHTRHVRLLLSHPAPGDARSPWRLDLFRTQCREWSMGFQPQVIGIIRSDDHAVDRQPLLAAAFGFTTAEAAIAGMLAKGISRQAIAARRGVTIETLRGQLKALYGKTGCRREAELVALLSDVIA